MPSWNDGSETPECSFVNAPDLWQVFLMCELKHTMPHFSVAMSRKVIPSIKCSSYTMLFPWTWTNLCALRYWWYSDLHCLNWTFDLHYAEMLGTCHLWVILKNLQPRHLTLLSLSLTTETVYLKWDICSVNCAGLYFHRRRYGFGDGTKGPNSRGSLAGLQDGLWGSLYPAVNW